jgi:SH3-like domain-containing protein
VIGSDGVTVPMFDAAGGQQIATVQGGSNMQVVEQTNEWVRVTESEPVHVDVWVQRAVTSPSDSDMGVPGGVYLPEQ